MTIILTLIAGVLYLSATAHIAHELRAGRGERRGVFLAAGAAAAILHGVLAAQVLLTPEGIDLGLFSAGSLVGVLIALVAIITSLFRPVAAMTVGAFPTAFTLLLLSGLLHDSYTPRYFAPGIGVHIALSVLAYAVLAMAMVHAVLLSAQNRRFREHRTLLRALPPIQTMEAILFELVAIGFVLLSLAIAAGMAYVDDFFAQHLVHKTVLTFAGWLALGVLLGGHRFAGWRGTTAVRWTSAAVALLAVAFFGSKFVLEMILGRSG
jgi:ABC-type uncharacterized transport system permease subunit